MRGTSSRTCIFEMQKNNERIILQGVGSNQWWTVIYLSISTLCHLMLLLHTAFQKEMYYTYLTAAATCYFQE